METRKTSDRVKIDDDFLISQGQMVYGLSKNISDLIDERMARDIQLYEGEFSAEEKKWSEFLWTHRLFINKTYTNTNRILADVLDALHFDPEEVVDISSWTGATSVADQRLVKEWLNYRLNCHPVDFYKEIFELGQDGLKTSYGVLKVVPKLKTEKIKFNDIIPDPETGEPVMVEGEEEVITAYEPDYCCVPPESVRVSSEATWKDYHRHPMVHIYERTRDELRRKGYKNVDAVGEATIHDENIVTTTREMDTGSPFTQQTQIRAAQTVKVYEFWDFLPGKDGFLESGSYILLGGPGGPEVVARGWQKNELPYQFSEFEGPRPPFAIAFPMPEAHKFKGKSYPEVTEADQQELNAIVNQEREAVARFLRPPLYLNRDANVDLISALNRRIGGVVQGDGAPGEVMAEIPMQNPLQATIAQRQRKEQDYAESGIPPNLLGAASNAETATDASQQLNNANKKVAFMIKNMVYSGVLMSLKMFLRLEQTYNPEMVPAGEFDLKVNIGVNKQSQLNKWFLLMDRANQAIASTLPFLQAGLIDPATTNIPNPLRYLEEAMRIMGVKKVEEFSIPTQPPMLPPGAEGAPGGQPSAPRLLSDPTAAVSQNSPQAPGLLEVIQ